MLCKKSQTRTVHPCVKQARQFPFVRLILLAICLQSFILVQIASNSALLKNPPICYSENAEPHACAALNIVILLDTDHRLDLVASTLRSINFYSKHRLTLHVISPLSFHSPIKDIIRSDADLFLYDYEACHQHVPKIWFIAQKASLAELCSLFLSEILPSYLRSALYIDVRKATVVSDITHCVPSFSQATNAAYLATTVDFTMDCSDDPDQCYPLAFDWVVPSGLECGLTPTLLSKRNKSLSENCRRSGTREPLRMHTGVMFMHLQRMRQNGFAKQLVQSSIYTWRTLNYRQASYGASDLVNSYFRLFPETLLNLPCGCNYQFSSPRREVMCPGQIVRVARASPNDQMSRSSPNRYTQHFNFFRDVRSDLHLSRLQPPSVRTWSLFDRKWVSPYNVAIFWKNEKISSQEYIGELLQSSPYCIHQTHKCSMTDRAKSLELDLSLSKDSVFVLTRTSGRPFFFGHMAESVREQLHPFVTHVIGTDDDKSISYLRNYSDVIRLSAPTKFDPNEVCRKCGSPDGKCAQAPPMEKTKARQLYFDCFCGTSYPMNQYINQLYNGVTDGWVLILDDDNLLSSKFALSELLAAIRSRDSLVAFRSHLGRPTPTNENFADRKVSMGDFDASNFAFHSKHLRDGQWPSVRCGDFHTAKKLASKFPVQWINQTVIHANPLRAALGGLGARKDVDHAAVTVVITSHDPMGWRAVWVEKIVQRYLDPSLKVLISRVVLVWNNPNATVPNWTLKHEDMLLKRRFVVVPGKTNSLNNRWTRTLQHIDSEFVLNLDDDVYVKPNGLICLLSWLRKESVRMVGPFVRFVKQSGEYSASEILDSGEYSLVLPRVLLLRTAYLREYGRDRYSRMREYVDEQNGHCDDILLNFIAQNVSNKPPLRVLLQEGALVDFYDKCWRRNRQAVGGLGLHPERENLRNECVVNLLKMGRPRILRRGADVGTCLPRGNALRKEFHISRETFLSVRKHDVGCTSGEDEPDPSE